MNKSISTVLYYCPCVLQFNDHVSISVQRPHFWSDKPPASSPYLNSLELENGYPPTTTTTTASSSLSIEEVKRDSRSALGKEFWLITWENIQLRWKLRGWGNFGVGLEWLGERANSHSTAVFALCLFELYKVVIRKMKHESAINPMDYGGENMANTMRFKEAVESLHQTRVLNKQSQLNGLKDYLWKPFCRL